MRMVFLWSLLAISLQTVACAQSELTLEKKAAKMIIAGFKGTNISNSVELHRNVVDRGVSGVILFEHNITPTTEGKDSKAILKGLVSDIQSLTDEQLFISVDQEGGKVNRLKSKYGFKEMPSHQSIGERDDLNYTREISQTIASEVSSVGFNVNYAPCSDVNVNPNCPVIGKISRSFSSDEQKVLAHSDIYITEHHKQGVLTSLKHFPGHGSSLVDSHDGFTDVTSTWQERELVPFVELVNSGKCDMMMVSHLFNGRFDTKHPASISKPTIDSLLRKVIGWNGVVISDDMQMKAITSNYGFEEAIQLGVEAGIDLFIVSSFGGSGDKDMPLRAINAIVNGVKTGRYSEKRLDESIERIEKLREKL